MAWTIKCGDGECASETWTQNIDDLKRNHCDAQGWFLCGTCGGADPKDALLTRGKGGSGRGARSGESSRIVEDPRGALVHDKVCYRSISQDRPVRLLEPPFPSPWMIPDRSSPSRVRCAASRPGPLRADPGDVAVYEGKGMSRRPSAQISECARLIRASSSITGHGFGVRVTPRDN